MLDYQSFICKKCGKAVLRTADTNYCQYCGAKLPELKEMPKVCCPMCHGTGRVEAQAVTLPYFNVMTNAEQRTSDERKE